MQENKAVVNGIFTYDKKIDPHVFSRVDLSRHNEYSKEINDRIDNAINDIEKYKTDLIADMCTSMMVCDIFRDRLLNVTYAINDHLKVLKSEKNKSFDDIITDDLECIINDIQKSM